MEEISGEVKQQLSSNLSSPNGNSMVMMTPAGSFHPARLLPPPLPFPLLPSRPSLSSLPLSSSFLFSPLSLTFLASHHPAVCFSLIYSSFSLLSSSFLISSLTSLLPITTLFLYRPLLLLVFVTSSILSPLLCPLISPHQSFAHFSHLPSRYSFITFYYPCCCSSPLISSSSCSAPFFFLSCSSFFQFAFPIIFFTSLFFLCLFTFLSSLLTPPLLHVLSIFLSLLPLSL